MHCKNLTRLLYDNYIQIDEEIQEFINEINDNIL
jgi:hypothetical protein